jgi:hypothetical protein
MSQGISIMIRFNRFMFMASTCDFIYGNAWISDTQGFQLTWPTIIVGSMTGKRKSVKSGMATKGE